MRSRLTGCYEFFYAFYVVVKKKTNARMKRSIQPKRVRVSSKKWAIGSVVILALAVPITMSLISQSQDIRQQAAETRINSTVITTVPTDILIISVSQNDGNAQQNNADGKGNSTNGNQGGQDSQDQGTTGQDGGSSDCTQEDTTERSGGGTMRTIIINCNGKDQTDDQSGSDGNNQTIKAGGKDGQVSAPKNGKNTDGKVSKHVKEGKKTKKDNRNWIQQFIDRILGRQGR